MSQLPNGRQTTSWLKKAVLVLAGANLMRDMAGEAASMTALAATVWVGDRSKPISSAPLRMAAHAAPWILMESARIAIPILGSDLDFTHIYHRAAAGLAPVSSEGRCARPNCR
jgi:hypothetical protein